MRAIDIYVESLDLAALGFTHTADKVTPGQQATDESIRAAAAVTQTQHLIFAQIEQVSTR